MSLETVYENIYERKPIITNAAHTARAISFVTSGDIYYGIGKTSAWEGNEDDTSFVPPEPDINADNLEELIGMKKAERVTLVKPDDNGDIEYSGIRFKTVSVDNAIEEKARWVLIETTIAFKDLPPTDYRQIGIYSHVRPKSTATNSDILLAKDIENVGILEVINNRKVVTRQSDTKDTYRMIIEC